VKAWIAALLVPAAMACGPASSSSGYGGNCATVSYSCPSPPPSFATTVAPIVTDNCLPCHALGGMASPPLNNYANIYKNRVTSLSTVVTCKMPLVPLSDKKLFLEWVACGAPDN
jgi:hypothetical protein